MDDVVSISPPTQIGIPLVVFYLLYDKPKELAIYLKLVNICNLGLLGEFISKELALELELSPEHWSNVITKLEKQKLLQKLHSGTSIKVKLTYPESPEIDQYLTKFLILNQNIKNKEIAIKVKNLRENLKKSLENCEVKEFTPLIYTYKSNTNTYIHTNEGGGERSLTAFSTPPSISNAGIGNSVTKTYVPPDKVNEPQKKKQQYHKFPKIQYNHVLNAYNRISGTVRKGNEMRTAWRQVRAMFLAGRTPKEIISFMEWIEEHKDEEKYKWFKFWTMGTVQKWLPDYLSGRLTNEEEEDDGLEQLN